MRNLILASALSLMLPMTAVAADAPAPAVAYSTSTTTIGDLLDNAKTKEVIVKYLPEVASNPQIEMARGMTLQDIKAYAPDQVTDAKLAQVDADLAKLK